MVFGIVYQLNREVIRKCSSQNSSYSTCTFLEIQVIEAQNNRGFWLPVSVVVISRPLLVLVCIACIVHDVMIDDVKCEGQKNGITGYR